MFPDGSPENLHLKSAGSWLPTAAAECLYQWQAHVHFPQQHTIQLTAHSCSKTADGWHESLVLCLLTANMSTRFQALAIIKQTSEVLRSGVVAIVAVVSPLKCCHCLVLQGLVLLQACVLGIH